MSPKEYVQSGKHLPEPLRDFHDAKELFKTMHGTMECSSHEYAGHVTWVAGQCYVIDLFLWWMGQRGYTLQRSRAHVDFRSLSDDIAERQSRDREAFMSYMNKRKSTPQQEAQP